MNPNTNALSDDNAALPRGFVLQERYVIDSIIGSGGMGHIYLAHQRPFNRPMAIKVMHTEHSKNEVLTQRFFQEAHAVSQLSHPNTVTVFDFGRTNEGLLFIAMEYVEGVMLGQLIREAGRLTLEDAVSFTVQIAQALGEAHQKGIIHRDLKPDNVMVVRQRGSDAFVKVLDFGIAKVVDGAQTFTQAGSIVGTPHYMAPEQARSAPIDGRADLYSLGCCLYEMLSGKPPYDGNSVVGILVAHQNNPVPPLSAEYPEMLRGFMRRAMGKSPEERPASASAFVAELMACFMATPPPKSVQRERRDSAVGIEERLRSHARARSAMSSQRDHGPMSVSSTLDGHGPMAGNRPLPTPGSYSKSESGSGSGLRLPRPSQVSRDTRPSPVPFRALMGPGTGQSGSESQNGVSSKTVPSGSHPMAADFFEEERKRVASNPSLGQAPTMAAGVSGTDSSPGMGQGSSPGGDPRGSQPGYSSSASRSQPGYSTPGSFPGYATPGSQPGSQAGSQPAYAAPGSQPGERPRPVSEAAAVGAGAKASAGAPGWLWPAVVLTSVVMLSAALIISSGRGENASPAGTESAAGAQPGAQAAIEEVRAISLDSDPTGATVVINGVPVGRSPLTHRVAEDALDEVRFEMRGYAPLRFEDVPMQAEGDNRLFGVMERLALDVQVRAPREGGVLLVNGDEAGDVSAVSFDALTVVWPDGEVELVWRHPDYEDVRRRVPAQGVKTPLRWEIAEGALVERSEG